MSQIIRFLLFSKTVVAATTWIGLGLAIYTGFFYSKSTEITYELLSNTHVVQVKEDLNKLDIYYDGKSLKQENKAIRFLTFRVINSGSNTIRIGDYDERNPLGFSISNGEILEPPRLHGSTAYLTDNLTPLKSLTKTSASFNPVIMEPNDAFLVTALVAVERQAVAPTLYSHGKIAGASEAPRIVAALSEGQPKPFINEVIDGKWSVQLGRAVVYFFTTLFLIIAITGAVSAPNHYKQYSKDKAVRQQRIDIANAYISENKKTFSEALNYVLREYVNQEPWEFFIRGNNDLRVLRSNLEGTAAIDRRAIEAEGGNSEALETIFVSPEWMGHSYEKTYAERLTLVSAAAAELDSLLVYLGQHGHPVAREKRKDPIFSLLPLNAYADAPVFNWYTEITPEKSISQQ